MNHISGMKFMVEQETPWDIYRGMIIVKPHGDYLIIGSKNIIIKAKKYMDCVNKPLMFIQDKMALGILMTIIKNQ